MMRTAITREEACERAAGRIYLAQEVMEKIKYKEKTQRFMAVPEGAVERGGQIFYVTVREKPEEIRGVPLLCVQVSVRDRQGQAGTGNAVYYPQEKEGITNGQKII